MELAGEREAVGSCASAWRRRHRLGAHVSVAAAAAAAAAV